MAKATPKVPHTKRTTVRSKRIGKMNIKTVSSLQVATLIAPQELLQSGTVPITPFQRKVYEALCLVPKGKVTSYKHLGRYIGCGSSQAVGQALRRNPYAPSVPCHRVVNADLSLGGFHGQRSGFHIAKKITLLRSEGVTLTENNDKSGAKIDPACLYTYDGESDGVHRD